MSYVSLPQDSFIGTKARYLLGSPSAECRCSLTSRPFVNSMSLITVAVKLDNLGISVYGTSCCPAARTLDSDSCHLRFLMFVFGSFPLNVAQWCNIHQSSNLLYCSTAMVRLQSGKQLSNCAKLGCGNPFNVIAGRYPWKTLL